MKADRILGAIMLICLGTPAKPLAGPPVEDWSVEFSRSYGGDDSFKSGCTDAAGNTFAIIALESEHRLVKYDSSGGLALQVPLEGSQLWSEDFLAMAVDASASGDVCVARNAWGTTSDLFVAKFSQAGSLLWSEIYDAGGNEYAISMAVDPAGNICVAGNREDTKTGFSDALLVKFSPAGLLLWSRTVDFGADDSGYGVAVGPSAGDVYLVGPAFVPSRSARYSFAAKFSPSGDVLFSGTHTASGSSAEFARAAAVVEGVTSATLYVAIDSGKNLYVLSIDGATGKENAKGMSAGTGATTAVTVGGLAVDGSGNGYVSGSATRMTDDIMLVKFDQSLVPGTPVFHDSGGRDGDRWPLAGARVGVDGAGNAYLCGSVEYDLCAGAQEDVLVKSYSAAGTDRWLRFYDSPMETDFLAAAADGQGGVYAAGSSGRDPVLVRYGSGGVRLWEKLPGHAPECGPEYGGMARGADRTLVAFDVYDPATGANGVSVQGYDANGSQVYSGWLDRIREAVSGPITSDAAGNVYMAGSFNSTTTFENELVVAKFDAAGAVAWTRTLSFAPNDDPAGIAFDGSSLYVLEAWPNGSKAGINGYGLLKFDPDGNLLWTRTYAGHLAGSVWAIPGGLKWHGSNLYFCGYEIGYDAAARAASAGCGSLFKLAASGDVVLSKSYDGGSDAAFTGLDVDDGGNIFVTGAIGSVATDTWDFLTVSYDYAGNVRWTKTRDWGSGNEAGRAVALSSVYVAGSSGTGARLVRYVEPGGLMASLALDPAPQAGSELKAFFTLTNISTTATVTGVSPLMRIGSGAEALRLVSGPSPASADIPPGGAAEFTWVFFVSRTAALDFTATGSGTDSVTGKTVGAGASAASAAGNSDVLRGRAIVVYPNPVRGDRLNVALRLDGDASEVAIELYDMAMRTAYRGTWRNVTRVEGMVTVDGVRRLAPGVYLLRARAKYRGGEKTFPSAKVVIKR
jgi:hypothetical protein